MEGNSRMRRQPMSLFGGGHFANAKTTDNRPDDLKIVKPSVHVSMLKGYRLGLQSEAEVMRLRAMDTEEELVVQIVNHDMFQNVEEHKATGARLRTKPRKQWRFEALFADGSLKWLSWAEANQQAALDRYAEIHPELNIPES